MFSRLTKTTFKSLQFASKSSLLKQQPFQMKFVRAFSGHPEHPSLQQVEDRVLALLKDFDKVDHTKLSLDAHFVNDLGLDSLDQVEITMALEDEFNIELADRDADDIFTPRQAVEKVYANPSAM